MESLSEDEKIVQPSNTVDQLAERFRKISLQPSEDKEFVFSGYHTGHDGFIRTHLLIQAGVGGEIIGENGEVAKRLTEKCGVRMHVQNVLAFNYTTVTLSARTKDALVTAQLEIWEIIGSGSCAKIKCDINEILLWSILNDEEKADFQSKYNVTVVDDVTCLKLSTFTQELLDAGVQFLTTDEDSASVKSVTALFADDPLKAVITVRGRRLAGFFYGKQGKSVEWMREHFETEISTFEHEDNTVVFLSSKSESQILDAQFDVWRSVSKIMRANRFVCRISIATFWNTHLTLEEKVQFMNLTKTFVAHIPDMDNLLIRGFTSDATALAKNKLMALLRSETDSDTGDDI